MASIGQGPVLLCYDGAEGSRRAIEWLGKLQPAADVVVLHLWDSPVVMGVFAPPAHTALAEHARAEAIAKEGAELARAAGLRARPFAAGIGASWHSVLAVARNERARLIVTGARGKTGALAVLGSMSKGVVQHAAIPVLVVPPARAGAQSFETPLSGAIASRRGDALARYVMLEARRGRTLTEIMRDEYVGRHASASAVHALLDRRDVVDELGREAVDSLRARIADLEREWVSAEPPSLTPLRIDSRTLARVAGRVMPVIPTLNTNELEALTCRHPTRP